MLRREGCGCAVPLAERLGVVVGQAGKGLARELGARRVEPLRGGLRRVGRRLEGAVRTGRADRSQQVAQARVLDQLAGLERLRDRLLVADQLAPAVGCDVLADHLVDALLELLRFAGLRDPQPDAKPGAVLLERAQREVEDRARELAGRSDQPRAAPGGCGALAETASPPSRPRPGVGEITWCEPGPTRTSTVERCAIFGRTRVWRSRKVIRSHNGSGPSGLGTNSSRGARMPLRLRRDRRERLLQVAGQRATRTRPRRC